MEPTNGNGNGHVTIEPEQITDAARSLRRTRTVEFMLALAGTVCALVASIFSAVAMYQVLSCTTPNGKCYERYTLQARQANRDFLEQIKQLVQDSGRCQLLQVLEHRDANETAHREEAAHHGYRYAAPPTEAPIPIPADLKDACAQFLDKKEGP